MISWCSASAVRFIGTHRLAIAIENDVSTSSATAAWVRASVSLTSMSRTSRPHARGWASPPSPAVRTTALVIVLVTFQGSVSPKVHSRLAPLSSPAAPAWRRSRCPWRPDIRLATSLSSALPSWRIAFGESLSWPSEPRLR